MNNPAIMGAAAIRINVGNFLPLKLTMVILPAIKAPKIKIYNKLLSKVESFYVLIRITGD